MKSKMEKKFSIHSKIYLFFRKIYFLGNLLKVHIRNVISIIFILMPIQNRKIVFCNYYGKGYGDNGKYIIEEIINQGLEYDIVWLLKKDLIKKKEFPSQVRIVEYGSFKGLYELATAKLWIDNCRKSFFSFKRKKQFYIQTWHGGIALKKIEKDVESQLSSSYLNTAKRDSKMADIFVSNSKFCTKMYQESFWYNKQIMEIGSPRCDLLLSNCNKVDQKVKEYYGMNRDVKLLIYAPTFRKGGKTDIYDIDFKGLLNVVKEKFGGNWSILVRMHPNISEQSNFMKYRSEIINATEYDDMYELLVASDILITDYSSTMFEFSYMKKPVFLYTPDLEEYEKDRSFYFELEELPYDVAVDNKSLFMQIQNFNKNNYLQQLDSFFTNLGILESGKASKNLVNKIKKIMVSSDNKSQLTL